MTMSDHQDSENFAYNRSWKDIQDMLYEAEKKQNAHLMSLRSSKLSKKQKIAHMRAYKGLEGVINGLRWVLGDLHMSKAKVLGDE